MAGRRPSCGWARTPATPRGSSATGKRGRWRRSSRPVRTPSWGPKWRAYGGRLPFLVKILAAARPLSLQVHPDKAHAAAAFAAENRSGATERDYLDDNHKPELISALRDGFEALCGFRPAADTVALLKELAVPELAAYPGRLAGQPEEEALRRLVTAILTEPDDHAAAIAGVARASRRVAAGAGRGRRRARPTPWWRRPTPATPGCWWRC